MCPNVYVLVPFLWFNPFKKISLLFSHHNCNFLSSFFLNLCSPIWIFHRGIWFQFSMLCIYTFSHLHPVCKFLFLLFHFTRNSSNLPLFVTLFDYFVFWINYIHFLLSYKIQEIPVVVSYVAKRNAFTENQNKEIKWAVMWRLELNKTKTSK